MYTFVVGGYRSGRSNYALKRASELGPPPWLYVATAQESDEAVRKRIERQRRDADAIWRTTVMPERLLDLLQPEALDGVGAGVIDGVSAWCETQLSRPGSETDALEQVTQLADRMYRARVPLVVVSTEMGLGMMPRTPEDQRLLKLVSSANQILARQASHVVLMVSGVPCKVG